MAKQKGNVTLDGKTGGMIFYTTRYGNMVRSTWTLSKEKLANDPKQAAKRDAISEFGYSSRVGKLMRRAVKAGCRFAETGTTHHRLAPAILSAVKEDKVGARGMRRLTTDNVGQLKGFRWREESGLSNVLLKNCVIQLDAANGQASLTVNGLVPNKDLKLQEGATHLQLTLMIARIDYDGDSQVHAFDRSDMLTAGRKTAVNVSLSAALPGGGGNLIVVGVGYQVQQEVNGQMMPFTEFSGFEIGEVGVV